MKTSELLSDLEARGFSLAPTAEGIMVSPSTQLTDADRAAIRQHKADLLAMLATKPGTCPTCQGAADLQDRQLDTWWCAGCREFFDGAGKPIPPASVPRSRTFEQVEPEQLAADLLAAGCGFVDDCMYFGVRMPAKISAELLARLDTADRRELRKAAAKFAEQMEPVGEWVNWNPPSEQNSSAEGIAGSGTKQQAIRRIDGVARARAGSAVERADLTGEPRD